MDNIVNLRYKSDEFRQYLFMNYRLILTSFTNIE